MTLDDPKDICGEDWQQTAVTLAEYDGLPDWRALHSSAQARVYWRPDAGVYLKIFIESKRRNLLRVRLFPAQARHRRFARNCDELRRRELPAPRVLACGDLERGRAWRGYAVTEAFDGIGLGTFCARYLRDSRRDPRLRQWKRRVMDALGQQLAELHQRGVVHGDLRPDNILLHRRSPEPRFCFIDNERNRNYRGPAPYAGVLRNLSQLNMIWGEDLSAGYRMRVMRNYLALRGAELDGRKLIREVVAISSRRLRAKVRGGYRSGSSPRAPDFEALLSDH